MRLGSVLLAPLETWLGPAMVSKDAASGTLWFVLIFGTDSQRIVFWFFSSAAVSCSVDDEETDFYGSFRILQYSSSRLPLIGTMVVNL